MQRMCLPLFGCPEFVGECGNLLSADSDIVDDRCRPLVLFFKDKIGKEISEFFFHLQSVLQSHDPTLTLPLQGREYNFLPLKGGEHKRGSSMFTGIYFPIDTKFANNLYAPSTPAGNWRKNASPVKT